MIGPAPDIYNCHLQRTMSIKCECGYETLVPDIEAKLKGGINKVGFVCPVCGATIRIECVEEENKS